MIDWFGMYYIQRVDNLMRGEELLSLCLVVFIMDLSVLSMFTYPIKNTHYAGTEMIVILKKSPF